MLYLLASAFPLKRHFLASQLVGRVSNIQISTMCGASSLEAQVQLVFMEPTAIFMRELRKRRVAQVVRGATNATANGAFNAVGFGKCHEAVTLSQASCYQSLVYETSMWDLIFGRLRDMRNRMLKS